MYLSRFNSWDANVILCLSTILPEALVITTMKIIKSVHEMYCLTQAKNFYCDRGTPAGVDMIYFGRGSYTPLSNLFLATIAARLMRSLSFSLGDSFIFTYSKS